MKEEIRKERPDYFLYLSYVVLIAIAYFFYQNGAYEWLHTFTFTTLKHYTFAIFFAGAIILILANIYTILGLALFYFLFKFALDLMAKSNF